MEHGYASSLSNQRNAVFGEAPMRASSFWDDLRPAGSTKAAPSADKPPSYSRRQVSVSALESFSAIAIKGSSACLNEKKSTGSHHPASPHAPSSSTTGLVHKNKLAPMNVRMEQQPKHQNSSHAIVKVTPDKEAPVRDMYETWSWIQRDFYLPVNCSRCSTDLTCIKDVDSVLCSSCGTISPVVTGSSRPRGGGLGLGLTFRDLRRCEMEGPRPM